MALKQKIAVLVLGLYAGSMVAAGPALGVAENMQNRKQSMFRFLNTLCLREQQNLNERQEGEKSATAVREKKQNQYRYVWRQQNRNTKSTEQE